MTAYNDFSDKNSWNVLSLLRKRADDLGEETFIEFDNGVSLSFRALEKKSNLLALSLKSLGLEENENVFCFLKNCPEFLISLFAILKCGAVFVPINTELRGKFLDHQFRNCEPKIAIVNNSLIDSFLDLEPLATKLKTTIFVGKTFEKKIPKALLSDNKFLFNDIIKLPLKEGKEFLVYNPSIHKICAIMYTSGTTGPSKGVMLTHGHLFSFAINSAKVAYLTREDVYYICMPLFHVNGLSIQCFAALYAGIRVYCRERFSPTNWLSDIIKSGATVTNLLGVMPEFVFNTAPSSLDKNHSLRMVSAVPISKEWGKAFEKRFNVKFLQGFGMTESGMSFWGDLTEENLIPGCAGYPMNDLYEVKIANPENDEFLPPNTVGELLIRPKHPGIFSAGYYKMPEKTLESWRNLWFHTGDACSFDEKGRMHYFDRIKDCIRRRGENISAFELEQVINAYECIIECAAIGVKTEESGGEDEVLVCIVKEKNSEIELDSFLSYCKKNLPRFAIPKFVRFVDSIIKTGSGKLSKVKIREEGLTSDSLLLDPSFKKPVNKIQ